MHVRKQYKQNPTISQREKLVYNSKIFKLNCQLMLLRKYFVCGSNFERP